MSAHRKATTRYSGVLAVLLAPVVLLTAGCGGSHAPRVANMGSPSAADSSSPSGSASNGPLAFARCMRSHGVLRFPDPGSDGSIPKKSPQQLGVSKSRYGTAEQACAHLLMRGSGRLPRQKLDFALAIARCLRAHGFPDFPDPRPNGQSDWNGDEKSPRFQAAMRLCQAKARRELHIPSPSSTRGGS